MSSSNLEWNGEEVLAKLAEAMKEATDKSTNIIRDETYELSRVDTGATRTSYGTVSAYEISKMVTEGKIGSPMMNAIYEEFGTGIYAENGNPKKPNGWVYELKESTNKKKAGHYFTLGKKPNKPMRRAFTNKINDVEDAIKTTIRRGMNG